MLVKSLLTGLAIRLASRGDAARQAPASSVPKLQPDLPVNPVVIAAEIAPICDAAVSPVSIAEDDQAPRRPAQVIDISAFVKSTVSQEDAVAYLIDDWIEMVGTTVATLAELQHAYRDLRAAQPAFPKVSDKKFSQLLTAFGCIPLIRDGRFGGDGRRVRVFDMRPRRRRAA